MARYRPPKNERRHIETRTTPEDVRAAINALGTVTTITADNIYEIGRRAANAFLSLKRDSTQSTVSLPRLFADIEALSIELTAIRAEYCAAERFVRFSNVLQRVARQTPMRVTPLRSDISGTVLSLQFSFPLGTGQQITAQISLYQGDEIVRGTETHVSSTNGDAICYAITLPDQYADKDVFSLRVVSEFRIGHEHSAVIHGVWRKKQGERAEYSRPDPPKEKHREPADVSDQGRQRKPTPKLDQRKRNKRSKVRPGQPGW